MIVSLLFPSFCAILQLEDEDDDFSVVGRNLAKVVVERCYCVFHPHGKAG